MISEEILKEWEAHLYEVPFDIENVVALIAEVRRLKSENTNEFARAETNEEFYKEAIKKISRFDKEADWLASKIAATTYCTRHKYCSKEVTIEDCKKCWREDARKAVNSSTNC